MPAFAPPLHTQQPAAAARASAIPPRRTAPLGNQTALRRLSRTTPRLQTSLVIGAANDPLEREADALADAVMRTATPAAPARTVAVPQVRRKCAACEDEEQQGGTVRMKPAARSDASAGPAPVQVRHALAQSGQPLDARTRAFFEPRLGVALDAVRVHEGSSAAVAAESIGARAFAYGPQIAFAAGAYAPQSDTGRRLIAHELAHVVQQSGGAPPAVRRAPPAKECEAPVGPTTQPDHVSQTLIARIEGKYAKLDGDPGEGCIPTPYPAGSGEGVCTIGYGHQIRDCPVFDKSTGAPPTSDAVQDAQTVKVRDSTPNAKPRAARPAEWLTCKCSDMKTSCPDGAEKILKDDIANSGEKFVHDKITAPLDSEKFDALVDLVLHHGSLDKPFIDEIHKYWCTPEGWDHLRDVYLTQNLQMQGSSNISPAFVKRRKLRAWPPSPAPAPPPQTQCDADTNTCSPQNGM